MKFEHKLYVGYNNDIETIETHSYPKSFVQIGDIVTTCDGSYAVCLENGELQDRHINMEKYREQWKVIATEGQFPTGLAIHNTLPGTRKSTAFSPRLQKEDHKWNDVMMVSLSNPNRICFIHSSYLVIIS